MFASKSIGLITIKKSSVYVVQIRNHVKIYPWRRIRSARECYLDNSKTDYTDKHNLNDFGSKRKKKNWQKVIPKDKDNQFNAYQWNESYESDPKVAKETAASKLARFQDSLRNRGAARESKAYNPPEDVEQRVLNVFKSIQLTSKTQSNQVENQLNDVINIDINQSRELKFNFLVKCMDEFKHDMPSSYLNDISSVQDVVDYFSTPVRGINPYTALLRQDNLPPNLALIVEPVRFDLENDEFFKKYNAFPGLVSKVPGLRASKKYPILNQDEFQWPDI